MPTTSPLIGGINDRVRMIKQLSVLVLCVGVLTSCSKDPIPEEIKPDKSSSVTLLGDWTLIHRSGRYGPTETLYCPFLWEFKLDGTRPEISYNRWRNDCIYRYTTTNQYTQTGPTTMTMAGYDYDIIQSFGSTDIILVEQSGQQGDYQRRFTLTR